jgi:hypothetical protein
MQEVSGSSPLSSTAQKRNSNGSNSEYTRKVQQRRPLGPSYVCSDRLLARQRIPGGESKLASLSPAQIATSSVPLLLAPGRHLAFPERHSRRQLLSNLQVATARSHPAGPTHSQEWRPLARAHAFADGRLGAPALSSAPSAQHSDAHRRRRDSLARSVLVLRFAS